MLPYIYLSLKTFFNIIFVVYYIIAIIIELYPSFTVEIYPTIQDLYIAINFHTSKKDYAISTK